MISIQKYNHKMQYIWDDFIAKSSGGTIFHLQKFLNYHIDRCFLDNSLMFYKQQTLVAVLPCAIIKNNKKKCLHSHPGASFGGFVVTGPTYGDFQEILKSLKKYCLKNKISSFVLTLAPNCYVAKQNDIFEYILNVEKYKLIEQYISHVVHLNMYKSPLLYLNRRKQRYIKNHFLYNKAYNIKKNVRINEFYSVLLKNKKNFGVLPTHSLLEIKCLLKSFPESIKLFTSFYNNKVVGGVLLFVPSNKTALLFYNAILSNFRNTQLSTFQIYSCLDWCLKNKFSLLDLGVSHLPNNKNPFAPKKSLIKFKEQFSAIGVTRKVYKGEFYVKK